MYKGYFTLMVMIAIWAVCERHMTRIGKKGRATMMISGSLVTMGGMVFGYMAYDMYQRYNTLSDTRASAIMVLGVGILVAAYGIRRILLSILEKKSEVVTIYLNDCTFRKSNGRGNGYVLEGIQPDGEIIKYYIQGKDIAVVRKEVESGHTAFEISKYKVSRRIESINSINSRN